MTLEQSLHRLVYVSINSGPDGPGERDAGIAEILEVSRRNNRRDGITGALLFSENRFAQVLEGELDAVMETFERIQCDPRHRETVILASEPAASREFGDWSMAYAGRVDDASLAVAPPACGSPDSGRTQAAAQILDLLRRVLLRAEVA